MPDLLLPDASLEVIAPGRVNLLGEHVDYNGGAVLPAAIDRSVRLAARPAVHSGRQVTLHALDLNQSVTFTLDQLESKRDAHGQPLPDWALYPAGVAWALQQNGLETPAFEGAFTSNVPIGAGLSSSAAVEVAFAALWQALGGWEVETLRLAQMAQKAENEYVGVNSGLMDQFASAMGVAGHVLYFNTGTLFWEPLPLPAETVIIIADSGVRRSLTGSAYNERRAACEEALRLLKPHLPAANQLCDISPAELDQHAQMLPEIIRRRAQHVVDECDRVERAAILLKNDDARAFGQLMYAGHASLRDLYQVSVSELDTLVEIASGLPGCYGARLTGAGFGGCTVNLVEEKQAQPFTAALKSGYLEQVGREAEVYVCHASEGVRVRRLL
jgi:galactokinase